MKSFRKELWFNIPTRRAFVNITPQVEEALREDNVGNQYTVDVEKGTDVRTEIAKSVVMGGFGLLEMRTRSLSLEDVFLRLVTEEEGA